MLALVALALQSAVDPEVMYRGKPISAFTCGHVLVVSDVTPEGPPADVEFHEHYAVLAFSGAPEIERTVFAYVDGVKVTFVTAKGPVRVLVPLSARPHHKIVSGSTSPTGGIPFSARADCT